MGKEADCHARFGQQASDGHARLEEKELLFRGDFRLKIPFGDVRAIEVKRGVMKNALPASLATADRIYVYNAGLGWDAASVFAPLAGRARCLDDLDALVRAIVADARPGDSVLIMSNGGFGGIHAKLLERLQSAAAA